MSFLSKFKKKKDDVQIVTETEELISIDNSETSETSNVKKKKVKKKTKIYIGLAIVLVIVIVGSITFTKYNSLKTEPSVQITTFTVPENEKVYINGIVIPSKSVNFDSKASPTDTDIRIKNGQKVKKGDVLFIIKDESAISEAKSLNSQISNLKKQKALIPSTESLQIAEINSQISSLNTNLSSANARAYTKYKAPFDGKAFLNSDEGNVATKNEPFITLQSNNYVMSGKINEQDLSKISIDKTANVNIISTNKDVKGRVSYISKRPSSGSDSSNALSYYNVLVAFDSQDGIVDGFHTQATIEISTSKHKIPSNSIIENNDGSYIFTDVDGLLKKVNIEVENKNDDYATVIGNIKPNDIIILNPTKSMKEGNSVSGSSQVENSESEAVPEITEGEN